MPGLLRVLFGLHVKLITGAVPLPGPAVWCRRTDELVDGPNASYITPTALDEWTVRYVKQQQHVDHHSSPLPRQLSAAGAARHSHARSCGTYLRSSRARCAIYA